MMVEAGLAEREDPEEVPVAASNAASTAKLATQEGNSSSKKGGKKRGKKSSGMPQPPTVVQRLYDTCKEVFAHGQAGVVPSPDDVARIRSILDNMNPADVGLNQRLPFSGNVESTGVPPVTKLKVYDCPNFSIAIFCLPPSGIIPLHNHPGMTVFSKLLVGSMHIKSYDWVDAPQSSNETIGHASTQRLGRHLAKVNKDTVFTVPCETSILYPAAGGNLHCFTARTSCAVLDVLGPPYNDSEGRHCAYYNNYPYESSSGITDTSVVPSEDEEYAWLEERTNYNFFVAGAKYKGPKIVEN